MGNGRAARLTVEKKTAQPFDRVVDPSAVGFAAMFHASNANHLALIMRADPVVADPQPKLRRLNALKALDITLTGFEISSGGLENTKGGTS